MKEAAMRGVIGVILIIAAYFLVGEFRSTRWIPQTVDHVWEEHHPDAYAETRVQEDEEKARAAQPEIQAPTFFPTTPAHGKVHDPYLTARRQTESPSGSLGRIIYTSEFFVRKTGKPVTVIGNKGKSVTILPGQQLESPELKIFIDGSGAVFNELTFCYTDGTVETERAPRK